MGERPVPSQEQLIEKALQAKKDLPRGNVWNERFCSFPDIHNSYSFPIRYLPEDLAHASFPVQRVIETMGSGVMVEGWRIQEVRVMPEDFIFAVFVDPTCELPWTVCCPKPSFVRPECRGRETNEFHIDPEFFDEAFRGTNHSAATASAVPNYYEWNQRTDLCRHEKRTIYQPGVVLIAMKLGSLEAKLRQRRMAIGEEKAMIQAGKDAKKRLPDLLAEYERIKAQVVEDPQRIRIV